MHRVGIIDWLKLTLTYKENKQNKKRTIKDSMYHIFEEVHDSYGGTLFVQSNCKWEPKRLEAET